jgi:hypothetical protein
MSFMTTLVEPAGALPVDVPVPGLSRDGAAGAGIGPAARSVVVAWATCLLLALSYPQALAAWLDDFEPNPVVEAAQGCVGRLARISETLGIAGISGAARELGRSITRKPD